MKQITNGQLIKAMTQEYLHDPMLPMLGTKRAWRGKPDANGVRTVSMSEYQALERNKYAPWGRGLLGGSQTTAAIKREK